jgi:hypothetical protein
MVYVNAEQSDNADFRAFFAFEPAEINEHTVYLSWLQLRENRYLFYSRTVVLTNIPHL